MQYDLNELERMTLDEVREIAVSMGLKPKRTQSLREICYGILDAQADNRAKEVQAREDAKAERKTRRKVTTSSTQTSTTPEKEETAETVQKDNVVSLETTTTERPITRTRTRGVKQVSKVSTNGMISDNVMATVGSEKAQLDEMQEQLKQNNHKQNKTVRAIEARKPLNGQAPPKPSPTLLIEEGSVEQTKDNGGNDNVTVLVTYLTPDNVVEVLEKDAVEFTPAKKGVYKVRIMVYDKQYNYVFKEFVTEAV